MKNYPGQRRSPARTPARPLTSATPPGPGPALCPPARRPPPGTRSPAYPWRPALLAGPLAGSPSQLVLPAQTIVRPGPHFPSCFWGPFSAPRPYCLVSLSLPSPSMFFSSEHFNCFCSRLPHPFCHFLVVCFRLSPSAPTDPSTLHPLRSVGGPVSRCSFKTCPLVFLPPLSSWVSLSLNPPTLLTAPTSRPHPACPLKATFLTKDWRLGSSSQLQPAPCSRELAGCGGDVRPGTHHP